MFTAALESVRFEPTTLFFELVSVNVIDVALAT